MSLNFQLGELGNHRVSRRPEGRGHVLMVDCGYPGFIPRIESGLGTFGLSMDQERKIVITHHDHDLPGPAREIMERYPAIEFHCSPEQAPYLTG